MSLSRYSYVYLVLIILVLDASSVFAQWSSSTTNSRSHPSGSVQSLSQYSDSIELITNVTESIDYSKFLTDSNILSSELNSDKIKSVLTSTAISSQISSFRFGSVNIDQLLETYPSGKIASHYTYYFSGLKSSQRLTPIARREPKDEPYTYLTFESKNEPGYFVSVVDRETRKFWGWKYYGLNREVILPVPLETSEYNVLLLQLAGDSRRKENDYSGMIIEPYPISSDSSQLQKQSETGFATKSLHGPEEPEARAEAEDPLTIYAAYTRRALKEAQKEYVNPKHLIISQVDMLTRILLYAGIDVVVRTPIVEMTKFNETQDGNEKPLKQMVMDLSDDTDSLELVSFRKRKKEIGADIGILIVHKESDSDCGWARTIGAEPDTAFAVVNWKCMHHQYYSYLHELGHLFGAYHDSETSADPYYAQAHVVKDIDAPFVTLMGRQQGQCGAVQRCARISYFSDPKWTYFDHPIGEPEKSDNARVIVPGVQKVVKFSQNLQATTGISHETKYANDSWSDTDVIDHRNDEEQLLMRRNLALNSKYQQHLYNPKDSAISFDVAIAAMRLLEAEVTINSEEQESWGRLVSVNCNDGLIMAKTSENEINDYLNVLRNRHGEELRNISNEDLISAFEMRNIIDCLDQIQATLESTLLK